MCRRPTQGTPVSSCNSVVTAKSVQIKREQLKELFKKTELRRGSARWQVVVSTRIKVTRRSSELSTSPGQEQSQTIGSRQKRVGFNRL